ncbi:MAG: GNAT family N-acetyltransferase [bacterium]
MTVSFRLAGREDMQILLECMAEFYLFDRVPFDEEKARDALRMILSDDDMGRVWMIDDDSQTVGYIVLTFGFSLEYHGRDAFIDEFYIRKPYRGRGIGKQTLRFLEEECILLNIRALHLAVRRSNRHARTLYEKHGFEVHDRLFMIKVLGRK